MSSTTYPADYNNDAMLNYYFTIAQNGGSLSPISGNSAETQVYNLISEMKSENNNILDVQGFMEALVALSNSPSASGNADIQALLSGITGSDGTSVAQFMAQTYATWALGASGSGTVDIDGAVASIQARLAEFGTSTNPFIDQFKADLSQYSTTAGMTTFSAQTFYWGDVGYFATPGDNTSWVDCSNDPKLFDEHLSGMVGNFINGSNLPAQLKTMRLNMFDEGVKEYGSGYAFSILGILFSTLVINDSDNQEAGVSANTKDQGQWTQVVTETNTNFNPTYFENDTPQGAPRNSPQNAKDWIEGLLRLTNSLDANSNASAIAASAKTEINNILNTSTTPTATNTTGLSLINLYKPEAAEYNNSLDPAHYHNLNDFKDLQAGLASLSQDPSAAVPGTPGNPSSPDNILDDITGLSKALTDAGQVLTTKTSALSANKTSMENVLTQIITALTKLYNAILQSMGQA